MKRLGSFGNTEFADAAENIEFFRTTEFTDTAETTEFFVTAVTRVLCFSYKP